MTAGQDLRIDVLGPLAVAVDGRPVEITTPRLRSLLVRLALDVGSTLSVERLVDDLWDGDPPPKAVGNLRAYLSNLRRLLGSPTRPGSDVVVTRGRGYVLDLPPDAVDAVRFEQVLQTARAELTAGNPDEAVARFEVALGLWQGEALADVRDHGWAQPEISRLEELRSAGREDRAAALLAAGRHVQALADLEPLATDPFRERPRELLMLALHRAGRTAEALELHRQHRATLADELGLDPGAGIERLAAAILRGDPSLLATRTPDVDALPATDATPTVAPARADPVSGVDLALVGRDAERRLLRDAAARVASDRAGSCILVAGEPGVGKTTLLEHVADVATSQGLPVRWGRCPETDGAPPLWPWREVIGAMLAGAPPGVVADLRASPAAPALGLVPDATGQIVLGQGLGTAEARFRLDQAVLALLVAMGPQVLLLDDLHWADDHTLRLVAAVSARLPGLPVLLVASHRDVEPDVTSSLQSTLATMARHPATDSMSLVGLDPEEIATLLAGRSGTRPDRATARALHDRTAGNPFFVQQLAALATNDKDAADAAVPAGIRNVVDRRVDLLGPAARKVLEVGAVVGRDWSARTVAAAGGWPVDEVLEHADAAVAHGLVVVVSRAELAYRFVHSLVRETLVQLLPPSRRVRLHAAVAETLDGKAGVAAEVVAEHWWEAAGIVAGERPVTALMAAAVEARRLLADDRAEVLLRRALDLLAARPEVDPRIELRVRLQLVQLLTARGGWTSDEVEVVAGRVREIADEAGIGPDLIPLWWALWNHHFTRGDLATADELAARLLADAESHDSPGCRVAGRVALATMALHRRGDLGGTFAHLAEARAAEALSPPVRLAAAPEHLSVLIRSDEALAHAVAGREQEAMRAIDEALHEARRVGAPFGEAHAQLYGAWIAALAGDRPRAAEHGSAALRLCARHGFAQLAEVTTPIQAWAEGGGDDPEVAAQQAQRAAVAVDALAASGHRHLEVGRLLLLADLLERAGYEQEAARRVEQAQGAAHAVRGGLADHLLARLGPSRRR